MDLVVYSGVSDCNYTIIISWNWQTAVLNIACKVHFIGRLLLSSTSESVNYSLCLLLFQGVVSVFTILYVDASLIGVGGLCSGDGGDGPVSSWSADHAPRPVGLLVKRRDGRHRARCCRLPVATHRRRRTTHQSHAHQLRPCQRPDRLVPHARPDAGCRHRQAEAEDLLPACHSPRTPLHPSVDWVRGIAAQVARVLVVVQRHGGRHDSCQSPQSLLPTSLRR